MRGTTSRKFTGEFLGTFLLVLFGCGAVGTSVLFGAHQGLFQVAMVWAIAVALAIHSTRSLSGAHLNPDVTLGMASLGRLQWREAPVYIAAQLLGAFAAAAVLYALLADSLAAFELAHGIVRGNPESVKTAMIFGEFYPNPGFEGMARVGIGTAFLAEVVGTFLLMLLILRIDGEWKGDGPGAPHVPLLIGLGVGSIICLVAPLTQAGLNPARDLGPRLFSLLAGWGDAAFPDKRGGFLWVYVIAPCLGSLSACLVHRLITVADNEGAQEAATNGLRIPAMESPCD